MKINKKQLLKNLEKLNDIKIRWGVRGENNVSKMIWNEFGTDNIPERPAFRLTFDSKKTHKKIEQSAHFAINQVLQGKKAENASLAIGEAGLAELKKTFTSNISPENADSTIAKKGEGKNTLYDSGELFRSLDYEVVV